MNSVLNDGQTFDSEPLSLQLSILTIHELEDVFCDGKHVFDALIEPGLHQRDDALLKCLDGHDVIFDVSARS